MTVKQENRIMMALIGVGYSANFLVSLIGAFFPSLSYAQMTCWQIADSMAVMASVLMTRYVGSRGQNIAAAGFTMLAIAYGISFGSSSMNAINVEKMVTVVLPLVPATFLISFCRLFPSWLRFGSLLIVIPFFFMYKHVIEGTYSHNDLANAFAYMGLQILGILWFVFVLKDYRRQNSLPNG